MDAEIHICRQDLENENYAHILLTSSLFNCVYLLSECCMLSVICRPIVWTMSSSEQAISLNSTTKTLFYTISFVFLFLFMEYSLNFISSKSTALQSNSNQFATTSHYNINDAQNQESHADEEAMSSENKLRLSLIEKEKLLIEKEEKYVDALQKINERDLKLNYVDSQLDVFYDLVNKYKLHTNELQNKLYALQNKMNQSQSPPQKSSSKSKQIDNQKPQIRQKVAINSLNDEEIEALLDQTRKQIKNLNVLNNIDVEKVIDKEIDAIIDKQEDEYIVNAQLVDFRLIWDLGIVLIAATFGGITASLFHQPLILGYLLGGSLVGPGGLRLIQQYVQVETLAHIGSVFLLFNVGIEFKAKKILSYWKESLSALILCCLMLLGELRVSLDRNSAPSLLPSYRADCSEYVEPVSTDGVAPWTVVGLSFLTEAAVLVGGLRSLDGDILSMDGDGALFAVSASKSPNPSSKTSAI